MPELPEVETIVRMLRETIPGLCVDRVRVGRRDVLHGDPRPLGRVLAGRRITQVGRRAKRILIELDTGGANGSSAGDPPGGSGVQLVFHLGMSGRLVLVEANGPREKHTHLVIAFADQPLELRFRDPRRFGGVWCLTGGREHRGKVLGPLGPEPLTLRPAQFRAILDRRRPIKALLLDQRAIAGLGNIYCDEALFDARIHPATRACDFDADRAAELLASIKKTLRRAIRHKGSTLMDYRAASGEPGLFQRLHRVYGRAGRRCKRCGGLIARLQIAGRSSFVCLRCQVRG